MPTFAAIQEEIAAMLSIPDEELTPEQRVAMDAYLAELAGQEAAKVDGFAQFLRLESAKVAACRKEAQRLAAKARTAEGRIAYLKAQYLATMQTHGLRKIQGDAYTLAIRESEAVVVPDDLSALEASPDFVRRKVTLEANKTAIKEALKSGVDVPGCELRKSYSLTVR